jgi:hypothetical protein
MGERGRRHKEQVNASPAEPRARRLTAAQHRQGVVAVAVVTRRRDGHLGGGKAVVVRRSPGAEQKLGALGLGQGHIRGPGRPPEPWLPPPTAPTTPHKPFPLPPPPSPTPNPPAHLLDHVAVGP